MPLAVFEFGDFKLDSERFELTRSGRSLRLERKPMELLILLAAKNGNLVTRTEIAERLWEREVFVDTEHGINTAVRKIRQVLGDDPEQPRFLQTVTGKGYRFIGPLAELASEPGALATVVSPAGNAEAEIERYTKVSAPIADIAEPTASNARKLRWLGAAGVVIATVCLALAIRSVANSSRSSRTLASVPKISSLAVLPLDNLSGSAAQDYLADGMTDELITMLAKNSALRVISRTSVMQYKGVHRPLPEIARELGVDGILEGSIARSGDKVHLNIQLIQAPSDTHVWAESYDRDANDSVSLPREAAQTIAKKLNSAVPQSVAPKFVNPEAHDAYLHGRYLWYTASGEKALPYFEKATQLQPDYALGWTGLAYYYGATVVDGDIDPREALAKEEDASVKAMQLDDTLPESHLSMSAAYLLNHWDWVRADQEILRAIELDPKYAEAHHFRAKILAVLNRHQEAIEEQKKATELDPFSRAFALPYSYQLARQYDAGLADAQQRLESSPHDPFLYWSLTEIYRSKGMYKEAVEASARESELCCSDASGAAWAAALRHAYRTGGYKAVLQLEIDGSRKKAAKQYVSPYEDASLYAQLGRRDETLNRLEEAYRQRSPMLLWIQSEPEFDFLHADERYRAIIRGMGLPPAY